MGQPVMTTSDVDEAVSMFAANGWTDGLPIVAPTRARVAACLATVARDPGEQVLEVPENRRVVTVEQAAINAVMAGCLPEYFPVVLAALDGWADDRWGSGDRTFFYMSHTSTGGGSPMLIVNGPVRAQLGVNSGTDVFGSGHRANATIGRAMRLIVRNVLGMTSGILDNACQGHPGKFSYCIGENEEESPWEPLHVEKGFAPNQSTVTTYSARGVEPIDNRASGTPEGILYSIADTMSRVGAMTGGFGDVIAAIIGPEHAHLIARHGWSKQDVKAFLYENFRRPVADMARAGVTMSSGNPRVLNRDGVDYLYGCRGPEDIMVVVAGGNNAGISSVVTSWCYAVPPGEYIIKPIAVAVNAH